jgi:hypothetical protein
MRLHRRGMPGLASIAALYIAAILAAFHAVRLMKVKPVQAQAQFKVTDAPLKKAWGPIRGTYYDVRRGELRLVFEDTSGTVRIVAVNPGDASAAVLCELRRD